MTVVDAFTREALAINVDQSINGEQVVAAVTRMRQCVLRRRPFGSTTVRSSFRRRLTGGRMRTASRVISRPGKPIDNAFVESFNGRLRDECLDSHWFLSLADARG